MGIKVGDLRPSQLIYTFGVGATVELPHITATVLGLEEWWTTSQPIEITEERVLEAVRGLLGPQVEKLAAPPVLPESKSFGGADDSNRIGVPVATFPTWLRCPSCDRLGKVGAGLFELKADPFRPDRARYIHINCPKVGKPPTAVPARFLVACEHGHLDDFPWVEYLHGPVPCASPLLKLRESGASGTAADVWASCDTCGSKRPMSDSFGNENREQNMPLCRGRRPHLRDFAVPDAERGGPPCDERMKSILLGASNSWFPLTVAALFVPTATNKLTKLVEAEWGILDKAKSFEILGAFREIGKLQSLAAFPDEEIWAAIEEKRNISVDGEEKEKDLKIAEWQVLSQPDPARNTEDFELREVAPPATCRHLIDQVVLVERLREVRALVGFTRIESPGDFGETLDVPADRRAPISRTPPRVVPASEVRGEGLFLRFNEDQLSKWEARPDVRRYEGEFRDANKRWRAARAISPADAGFPGMRFLLMHSFSHALMRQFSLECGYAAASIRERIYSKSVLDDAGPMAGVLLYTAAPDSEGTLGGLVRLGDPKTLERHIYQVLEQIRLCAADPLCAEHHPCRDGISLHGAACHACLFAPETSCERGNKFLDRNVLLQTVKGANLAFCE